MDDKVKHNPNCDCGICSFCDGTEDVWGNRKYKDSIRSECVFDINWWGIILLIIRRRFTIGFKVQTENVCGGVSDAQFDFTVEPIIKRKLPQGQSEIPKQHCVFNHEGCFDCANCVHCGKEWEKANLGG